MGESKSFLLFSGAYCGQFHEMACNELVDLYRKNKKTIIHYDSNYMVKPDLFFWLRHDMINFRVNEETRRVEHQFDIYTLKGKFILSFWSVAIPA